MIDDLRRHLIKESFFLMLNGKFNDKWLEMWYDKLVRRCETEKNMDVLYEYLRNNYEEDKDA